MVSWAALDQNRQNECSTASALKLLSAGFPQQTKWAATNTPFCGPSPSLQPTSTHRNACCMFWLSIAFLFWLSLVFAFWLPFSRASPCCFEFCFFWFAVPVPVSKLWCSSPSLGRPWFCPLNSYSRLCFPRAGLYAGANPGPISPIARDDMLIIHQGQFAKGRSWVMVGQPEQQNYNTSVTHPKNIHDLNKKLTEHCPCWAGPDSLLASLWRCVVPQSFEQFVHPQLEPFQLSQFYFVLSSCWLLTTSLFKFTAAAFSVPFVKGQMKEVWTCKNAWKNIQIHQNTKVDERNKTRTGLKELWLNRQLHPKNPRHRPRLPLQVPTWKVRCGQSSRNS